MIPVIELGSLNFLVGLGALLLQVASLVLILSIIFRKSFSLGQKVIDLAGTFALPLSFFLFLGALLMSLYYSEIYGFVPCGLCWLQRTFMYPQVFLFALAWWKKDTRIADYSITLSLGALLIGLYQHYLQMGGADVLPCPAAGPGADCAARILFEFGYITFPLVGVSLAAFAIFLMISLKISTRNNS